MKIPPEKHGKWHFRGHKNKKFLGEHAPKPPLALVLPVRTKTGKNHPTPMRTSLLFKLKSVTFLLRMKETTS